MTEVREATQDDLPGILELQAASYPQLASVSAWKAEHLSRHMARFGAGQLVAVDDGKIVGYSASFITHSPTVLKPHTFREATHFGTFDGHDPDGDTLYGCEMMVHPDERQRGVGRLLYNARFDLARRLSLRYFVAGGRLPGYSEVQEKETIEQYVQSVVDGKRTDRVLTPQLRNGLRVVGILPSYLNDPKSENYAALLLWENPDLGPPASRHKSLNPSLASHAAEP